MENVLDLEKLAKQNENFRKVVLTGKQSQMVLMSLRPGEELGEEVHATTDQMFFVEEGQAELHLDARKIVLHEDQVGFVPAGTRHNLMNLGKKPLKLVTVYAPPVHAPDTIEKSAPKHVTKI